MFIALTADAKQCADVLYMFSLHGNKTLERTEPVVRMYSVKKMFLKISQNSQQNTCIRVCFPLKLLASGLRIYWKIDSDTAVFLWIFQHF